MGDKKGKKAKAKESRQQVAKDAKSSKDRRANQQANPSIK